MNTPPIFVISLARAKERRADMIRRLDADNLRYEIVDAVDGAALDLSQYKDRLDGEYAPKAMGRPMNNGEIGCYLSHYNLWGRIVSEQIPYAVVLEDDAQPDADFMRVVSDIVSCRWKWDVVILSYSARRGGSRVLCPLAGGRKLVLQRRHPWTTAAYLVSLSGAEKLHTYCRRIQLPIDSAWMRWWRWGGRFYFASPGAAKVPDDESASLIAEVGRETGTDKKKRMNIGDKIVKSAFAKGDRWARLIHFRLHRPQKAR